MSKIRRELLKSLSRGLRVAPAAAHFEGLDLKIPLIYGLGADHLSRGAPPWTYSLLRRLLQSRPGAFVDIGANVGLYLIWLKSIDPGRPYVGFEPNPACHFYLQELIRCNGFADSSVFPLALSDARRLATFYARRLGDKMGSLLADHRVEQDRPFSFKVITEPGDPVLAALDVAAISAVKIDVEGAELEVLRGLSGALARYRPPLICEILTPASDQSGAEASMRRIDELLSLVGELDYAVLSLGEDAQLGVVRNADDLRASPHPDRVLVPSAEIEQTVALWQAAQDAGE